MSMNQPKYRAKDESACTTHAWSDGLGTYAAAKRNGSRALTFALSFVALLASPALSRGDFVGGARGELGLDIQNARLHADGGGLFEVFCEKVGAADLGCGGSDPLDSSEDNGTLVPSSLILLCGAAQGGCGCGSNSVAGSSSAVVNCCVLAKRDGVDPLVRSGVVPSYAASFVRDPSPDRLLDPPRSTN